MPADRLAEVRALTELMPRFLRLIHAAKTQLAGDGRDRAPLVLLYPLVRVGPLRQSALAELVHADPSTVSRHVTSLVDQGLVRRVADESDGRASKLHVTDEGRALLEQIRREREAHVGQVTADWTDADLTSLTALFARFLDDFAATLPAAVDPEPVPSLSGAP